jgi:O-antigen ligase
MEFFLLLLFAISALIFHGLFLLTRSFCKLKEEILKEEEASSKSNVRMCRANNVHRDSHVQVCSSLNIGDVTVLFNSKLFKKIFSYLFGILFLISYIFFLIKVSKITLLLIYLGLFVFIIAFLVVDWSRLLKLFIAALFLIPANLYKLPVDLPFDLEIYRLVAFLMFGAWFIALLIDKKVKLRKTPFDFYLFLISFSVFISMIINLNRFELSQEFSQGVKAFFYFLSFVVLYYVITSTIRSGEGVESICKFAVGLGVFVGFFGIIERVTGFNLFRHLHEFIPILKGDPVALSSQLYRGGLRVAGSVAHPIAFGTMLAMLLPFSLHFWREESNKKVKLLYLFSSILILLASLLTVSRTALISILLVLTCYFIAKPSLRKQILCWSLIGGFLVHMLFPGTLGRFRATLSPQYIKQTEINNPSGRLEDYPRAFKEFSKFPLFGRGFGTFDPKKYFYLDNQYLGWLIELGLFGIFVHLLLFYSILKFFWKARQKVPFVFPILVSSLVFITVCATFDTMGFSQIPYLFFLLIALGTSLIANIDLSSFSENKKGRFEEV